MKVYDVTYKNSDYTDMSSHVTVCAATIQKAAEQVGKRNGKYTRSSGRVTQVQEIFDNVLVVK